MDGDAQALDTVSISALAAAAFSSTAAMAQLLGEPEFSVLFHEGTKRSIHVSTVDDEAILLAIFDERTTVGMVRLFATEASRAVGGVLGEARARPEAPGRIRRSAERRRVARRVDTRRADMRQVRVGGRYDEKPRAAVVGGAPRSDRARDRGHRGRHLRRRAADSAIRPCCAWAPGSSPS